mgnify:FL=1
MKIKERIIFKDMTLASAIAAAICLISSYALLPLIFRIIDKSFPLEIFYTFVPPVLLSSVLFITFICIGALSVQYIRSLMLFGCTRTKAFWKTVLVSLSTIVLGTIVLGVVMLISKEFLVQMSEPSFLFLLIRYLVYFVFAYAIGLLCSSLCTICKPPLSVLVCGVALYLFLDLQDALTNSTHGAATLSIVSDVFSISETIETPLELFLTALVAALMIGFSYVCYLVKISSVKSTSTN